METWWNITVELETLAVKYIFIVKWVFVWNFNKHLKYDFVEGFVQGFVEVINDYVIIMLKG